MLTLSCQIMVFTNIWKLSTAIHIAYPHTARLRLRIWYIKGSNAKITPRKYPMGVIGYGVSPAMSNLKKNTNEVEKTQFCPLHFKLKSNNSYEHDRHDLDKNAMQCMSEPSAITPRMRNDPRTSEQIQVRMGRMNSCESSAEGQAHSFKVSRFTPIAQRTAHYQYSKLFMSHVTVRVRNYAYEYSSNTPSWLFIVHHSELKNSKCS